MTAAGATGRMRLGVWRTALPAAWNEVPSLQLANSEKMSGPCRARVFRRVDRSRSELDGPVVGGCGTASNQTTKALAIGNVTSGYRYRDECAPIRHTSG